MRFLTLLAVFQTAAVAAQDYQLSPEGDAADGSPEHSWRTLAKANRSLRALRPGGFR